MTLRPKRSNPRFVWCRGREPVCEMLDQMPFWLDESM